MAAIMSNSLGPSPPGSVPAGFEEQADGVGVSCFSGAPMVFELRCGSSGWLLPGRDVADRTSRGRCISFPPCGEERLQVGIGGAFVTTSSGSLERMILCRESSVLAVPVGILVDDVLERIGSDGGRRGGRCGNPRRDSCRVQGRRKASGRCAGFFALARRSRVPSRPAPAVRQAG